MTPNATSNVLDANDPPVLGANPLVGLTRGQIAAALARLGQRVAVEPGVALSDAMVALSELLKVAVGRSDVSPTKAVIVNTQKPNEPIEIGLAGP